MISFLTLILGLAYGTLTVEFSTGPEVTRIDLYIDGRLATEVGPPWKARLDLGNEIAPHEILAVARGADGARLGDARQWINRAKADAEARFVLERDDAGKATSARLVWSCPSSPEPTAFDVSLDGKPIEVTDPLRIRIPSYSSGASHILLADLTFEGGVVASAVVSLGGETKEDVDRELTAFPVRLTGESRDLPGPAGLRGWFRVDGRDLTVAAIENGTAEVVFVPSGLAFQELKRIAGEERPRRSDRSPPPKELDTHTIYRFLSPMPQTVPGTDTATRVFPISEDYTSLDGPFLRVSSHAAFTQSASLPRVAEAVAVSGLSATTRERRRAVVLLLGKGTLEASDFDAGRASRYLSRLRVPLQVWRLVPPETPVAPGWPDALDVSTIRGLRSAFRTLREDLAAQRVIWLEGRVDPSKVEVSSRAVGLVRAR